MPRITKEDKARNRQNIVEAAGRMFRSQGVDAVGIAAPWTRPFRKAPISPDPR
ncbi:hypothetical protein [Streptomyces sp. PRh5]|uniref:hypothetical protein n=1 Tax=Streptomyces sp. PRh5 TaxID=1158056 RepID=UPI0004B50ECE|nr:hypothetical protein [Streptomyces sp. PRh5]